MTHVADRPAGTTSLSPTAGRSARVRAAETRLRWMAVLLDDLIKIPGTGRRTGIGPMIGLIPVVGDVLTAIPGAWLILEAARFRLPASVLSRMVVNLVVDLAIGLIPIVGDLFDFGFKSNMRNLDLFRRYAADPDASTAEHRRFFGGLLLVVLGLVLLMGWAFLAVLRWLDSFTIALP